MNNIYSDEYWSEEFSITQDDVLRIAERIERSNSPQDLKTIALPIIKGRLEHGHDLSPAALQNLTGKTFVQLWDPEKSWQLGDLVLVAKESDDQHIAYLGKIITLNDIHATFFIDEISDSITFARLLEGTELTSKYATDAETWRKTVKDSVELKYRSDNFEQKSNGIFLKHGERILNLLSETLLSNALFIELDGKWYLIEKLPVFESAILKTLHKNLIQLSSFSLDDVLKMITKLENENEIIQKMTIQHALQKFPERFEKIESPLEIRWKALSPEPSQAQVLFHAYDPQTYEILCSPNKPLNNQNAERLLNLGIYNQIVAFSED